MIGTAFGIGTPLGYPTQQLNPYGASFFGAQGAQTLQQAVQLLQFLPQQLQQLQQLLYAQHQQLQQLLHQIQQMQQAAPFQQPFISTPWGIAPQTIGAQPSQVM